jgi:hypothetical protein
MSEIQPKRAIVIVAALSVEEFLCYWDEDYAHLNRQPTQDDYDEYLMHRATETYIGTPHKSHVFFE